jgi:hypothetical protein
MKLDDVPRLSLGFLPTPIEKLERLGAELGIGSVITFWMLCLLDQTTEPTVANVTEAAMNDMAATIHTEAHLRVAWARPPLDPSERADWTKSFVSSMYTLTLRPRGSHRTFT